MKEDRVASSGEVYATLRTVAHQRWHYGGTTFFSPVNCLQNATINGTLTVGGTDVMQAISSLLARVEDLEARLAQ